MHKRISIAILFTSLLLGVSGCNRHDNHPSDLRRPDSDADTAARKAGRAAFKASREAEKLAVEAGRELKDKAHEAHEGWKDAQRESRDRRK